jgi:hypothetical protein
MHMISGTSRNLKKKLKYDCFTYQSRKLVLVYVEETQRLDNMDGYLQLRRIQPQDSDVIIYR